MNKLILEIIDKLLRLPAGAMVYSGQIKILCSLLEEEKINDHTITGGVTTDWTDGTGSVNLDPANLGGGGSGGSVGSNRNDPFGQ